MKKNFCVSFIASCMLAFGDPFSSTLTTASDLKALSDLPIQDVHADKQGFVYVKFAASESDLTHVKSVLPGLGIGYRRLAGHGAADISISGIGHAEHRSKRFFWTAPKASYIHYLQPDAKKSVYVGGGIAWGGVDFPDQDFIGIIPSAMAGYEFIRKDAFLSFAELTISQPTISIYRKGSFPGPSAEFSVGMGF